MSKFRSREKLLRKGIPLVILWMVLAGGGLPDVLAQGRSAYIVNTLGSLFTIDIGTESGLEAGSYYRLYLYAESAPAGAQWGFAGIILTQQAYPFLTICKIIENAASYTPANSDVIALYPTDPPEDSPEALYQPKVLVQELPDEEVKRPLEEPSIQWNLSKRLNNPMGFGIQALYGYQNVPAYINNNIETYLSEQIYLVPPLVTKESNSTSIGQSFTLQKIFPGGFNGRFGYGHMVFKGSVRSELPADVPIPAPVPDEYVKKWDMTLKTVMHDFSFVLLRGGVRKIKDILSNKPNSGGFAFHWGFGINFARINYDAETRTTLLRLGRERIINDKEKLPGRWHWGAMGLTGVSHNSGFGTIFIESGINWWKTDGLEFSYPARAGVIIYF